MKTKSKRVTSPKMEMTSKMNTTQQKMKTSEIKTTSF